MTTDRIDIRRGRDFGEVFNATFAFIKQNIGVLVKGVLFFVAPLAAVSVVAMSPYVQRFTASIMQGDIGAAFAGDLLPLMLIGMLVSIATYSLLFTVVYGVMALYEEMGPGQFSAVDAVKRGAQEIRSVVAFSALAVVVSQFGSLGAMVPCLGLLVYVFLFGFVGTRISLAPASIVLGNRRMAQGVAESWQIVRTEFWQTLGILICTILIVSVLGGILMIPIFIGMWTKLFVSQDPAAMMNIYDAPWKVAYMVVVSALTHILYVIPVVAAGIQYGNLSESVTQSGLMDRLSAFAAGPGTPPEEGAV